MTPSGREITRLTAGAIVMNNDIFQHPASLTFQLAFAVVGDEVGPTHRLQHRWTWLRTQADRFHVLVDTTHVMRVGAFVAKTRVAFRGYGCKGERKKGVRGGRGGRVHEFIK